MSEIVIGQHGTQLTVSSVQVAADFGKNHKDVLESIKKMRAKNSALMNMFIENTYKAEGNRRTYKCYDLTRDGFSLLVMGFTGKDALDWKLRYIDAFNRMEQKLRQSAPVLDNLSPQLQYLIQMEQRQNQLEQRQTELEQKLDADRDAYVMAAFEFGRIGALQRAEIQKAVKVKAIDLCEYAETYDKVGKRVINSIYKALQKRFDVPSYLDLQYQHYTDALIFIQCWQPTKALCEVIRKESPRANFSLLNMLME